jgi:hypothetical protein
MRSQPDGHPNAAIALEMDSNRSKIDGSRSECI